MCVCMYVCKWFMAFWQLLFAFVMVVIAIVELREWSHNGGKNVRLYQCEFASYLRR